MRICPVNYNCHVNKYCPNFANCYDLSLSWEIPYEQRKDGIYVKRIARRMDKEGNQPYLDSHEQEIKERIMQCWNNAGFIPSVFLSNKL